MNNSAKLFIESALAHPDWDAITVEELDVSPDLIEATVRRFQDLCGLDSGCDLALLAASEKDVRCDGALFLKLNEGLDQFAAWFLFDDWSTYCMSEVSGSALWVVDVCRRVQEQVEASGRKMFSELVELI